MGCADCIYCVTGLRDTNDNLCVACTKMPSNVPGGCEYMIIDHIEYLTERMWFCPLRSASTLQTFTDLKGAENVKRKKCHDKRLFYDRQKEPLDDPEWFKAENTGKKHYYWVEMYNGGKTIKLYTQALADLWSKRTGLHTQLI